MGKEKVFGVFGLGTFGTALCLGLTEKGAKVIAIDNQEKFINKVKNEVMQAILMDTTDHDALMNAGLDDIDIAIVAIGDNIDASILTTATLKEMNIPVIMSRAISEMHAKVLKQIGATEIVYIEVDEGKRIANKLTTSDILEVIPVSKDQSIVEIKVPKEFIDKTLLELDLRKKYNINVILIKRIETEIDEKGNAVKEESTITPNPRTVLKEDDTMFIIGNEKDMSKMVEV